MPTEHVLLGLVSKLLLIRQSLISCLVMILDKFTNDTTRGATRWYRRKQEKEEAVHCTNVGWGLIACIYVVFQPLVCIPCAIKLKS